MTIKIGVDEVGEPKLEKTFWFYAKKEKLNVTLKNLEEEGGRLVVFELTPSTLKKLKVSKF